MTFERISLKNYRCFNRVDISFKVTNEKPIVLFIGANGAGKSEFLYSFQWILYGVDFFRFKGKQKTPFSLNLEAFESLKNKDSVEEECTGELFFESSNVHYRVIKKEVFRLSKSGKPESCLIEQYLQKKGTDNSWNSVASGVEQVKASLNPIIPPSLLSGIIFDGEEMLEIASPDPNQNSKQNGLETIKGVIAKITDNRLISLANTIFTESKNQTNNTIIRKYKGVNQQKIEELGAQIKSYSEEQASLNNRIENNRTRVESLDKEFIEQRSRVEKAEEIQRLFNERDTLKETIRLMEKEKQNKLKSFQESLKKGYFLITDNLTQQMKRLIDQKDVPEGLTVAAANNILNRSKCICGNQMTQNAIATIKQLLPYLPPANISAQLREEVSGISYEASQAIDSLKKDYEQLRVQRNEITKAKRKEASLTAQLEGYSSESLKTTIAEALKLESEIERLKQDIIDDENDLAVVNKKIQDSNDLLQEIVSKNKECKILLARYKLYDKFLSVIDDFKKRQHQVALNTINANLKKSYASLSEDYEKGRRLIIGRYSNKTKYQLMPYYENTVNDEINRSKRDGTYARDYAIHLNLFDTKEDAEESLFESYVERTIDPSSTGQLSIATLAFIKAVLDYSTSVRADIFTQNVSYPLVLDSPFSNIGDENLSKVGKELPSFAKQIIFLSSSTSFSLIKDQIMDYVESKYFISKQNSTHSIIGKDDANYNK